MQNHEGKDNFYINNYDVGVYNFNGTVSYYLQAGA